MERLSVGDPPEQWAMHSYRYEVAARFTRPTDLVVDAACGIGYGREILHGQWVGADRIGGAGIEVDLETWSPEFDFDVFVGLETIEHLPTYGQYVEVAKRARRFIVISTPIIPTTHFNPHHVHDFEAQDIVDLFVDREWKAVHFETQADVGLPALDEVYGIWAFEKW